MFYHVRVECWGTTGYALNVTREFLEERVLKLHRQGTPISLNGREFDSQEASIKILETQEKEMGGQDSAYLFEDEEIPRENDVTNDFIVGPPGDNHEVPVESSNMQVPSSDTCKVFVVHGRNDQARNALYTFLRAIGLHPLEWDEARQATGKPTPYIGEIVDAGISHAYAVIVLFTPDDLAMLKEQLRDIDEPNHETELTGQARPNVLFEAGMAMGQKAERTVLVELGHLRPFSDISGRHVIRLDNSRQRRRELASRLESAGCPVNIEGVDWDTAGVFDATVSSIDLAQPETVAKATQHSESEEKREYMDTTAQDIMNEAHDHISDKEFVSPEIGKWLRVDDKAMYAPFTTNDPIEITIGKPFEQISLYFDNAKWRSRLASIKEGCRIIAEGRIVEVEFAGLTLHDCELLDVAE